MAEDPRGIKKYRRKLLFVRMTPLLRELKEQRDYNAVAAQAQVCLMQDKLRDLMDRLGVLSDLRHQYMAYALALDKTQKEMAWMVDLIREHTILRDRFERRGLDPTVLDALDQLVIYRTRNR